MANKELDTEHKIKEAARKVFQEKGFSATKTRDIAEEAEINLALLNYYFRSKKKLYDIIMIETLHSFFSGLIEALNDKNSSLQEKISLFVDYYIDVLSENQNLASFILNAVRENPESYISQIGLLEKAKDSIFVKQFLEAVEKEELPNINPIHFLLNLMGLVVFPYIAQPMISAVSGLPKDIYINMIKERKRLVPLWIEAMLKIE